MERLTRLVLALLAVLLVLALTPPGLAQVKEAEPATQATAFQEIVAHYQPIWRALADDGTTDLFNHAAAIQEIAASLAAHFDPVRAGVAPADGDKVHALIPKIANASGHLALASTADEARAPFAKLSEALIAWRELVKAPRPVVVACAATKQRWLQPAGEIRDPYNGRAKPRCGDVAQP